jgi:hypothetical protein
MMPQWKTNFNVYVGAMQKLMNDGPKSMLGIRILVCLDPDLIGQIQVLKRTMAARSQLDSEL